MLNLIKADLYRILSSDYIRKSAIALTCVTLFLALGISSADNLNLGIGGGFDGEYYYALSMGVGASGEMDITNHISTGVGSLLVTTMIVMFLVSNIVIKKYSVGSVKNIIAYGHSKQDLYFSNLIASTIVGLGVVFLYYLLVIILQLVFKTPAISVMEYDFKLLIINMFRMVLPLLAVISLVGLFSICSKNNAIVNTTCSLMFLLGTMLMVMLGMEFEILTKINQFNPWAMIFKLGGDISYDLAYQKIAIHAIIVIIVTNVIAAHIATKEDIN